MTVKFEGSKLLAKFRRAQIKGVNKTMQASATHARKNHEWKSRTFELESSIQIHTHARPDGKGVSGIWGSLDIAYALVHELGSDPSSGQNIPARPYLRPAADAQYPALAGNIRDALRRAA